MPHFMSIGGGVTEEQEDDCAFLRSAGWEECDGTVFRSPDGRFRGDCSSGGVEITDLVDGMGEVEFHAEDAASAVAYAEAVAEEYPGGENTVIWSSAPEPNPDPNAIGRYIWYLASPEGEPVLWDYRESAAARFTAPAAERMAGRLSAGSEISRRPRTSCLSTPFKALLREAILHGQPGRYALRSP